MAPALLKGRRMIDPIFQSGNYQLARKLLDGAVLRQEAIASNIANSETPGYRRMDITGDFASELRARVATMGASAASLSDLQPHLAEDPRARTVRPDGNSVEVENELLEMNRNTMEYNFMADVVSYNIKQLRVAITGRTTA